MGKFVYALDGSISQVAGFNFNATNGALTGVPGSPFKTTSTAPSLVATPSTQFVFVSDWMNQTIITFKADPATGALTQSNVTPAPQFRSLGMLMDPNGKFLVIPDNLTNQIGVFAINGDGTLTQVPGSPFAMSSFPTGAVIDQSGKFLFVASDNMIFAFSIGSNGALTAAPGSPITVRPAINNPDKGPFGVGLAVDPSARFLFVPDTQSSNIWVYAIDPSNGSLTQVNGSPFNGGGGFGGVATVDPSGRFLYVTGGPQVAAYTISSTGAVAPVAGSPFDNGPHRAGGAPVSDIITDPQGKFLLLADEENSEITVFSINPSTGALTNVNGSPFKMPGFPIGGGSPSEIAMTH